MRLPNDQLRDVLAAEFAIGLLRGPARRRFARMLEGDPDLRRRLDGWLTMMPTEHDDGTLPRPAEAVWCGIRKELGLPPRWRLTLDRLLVKRVWAVAATAALAVVVAIGTLLPGELPLTTTRMAMLSTAGGDFVAWARIEDDGATLRVALQPPLAPPSGRTYEFWYIAANSKTPLSLGTREALGGSLSVPPARRAQLRQPGVIAVSLEPAGGSPTGLPTGPVLFTAELRKS